MQNDASSPTQTLASPQALQAKTRPPAYSNTSLRQHIRVAVRKAMQAQNRPNGTLEEKKTQVLGAALHIWQYNPHLDFENISSVLNQYFDFSRADIAELQNRLWFNRPDEVRQRLAGEGISYAENIEGAETPQEESGHDV